MTTDTISNRLKEEKLENRVKTKIKVNCIDSIIGDPSVSCDLCLYRQQDVAL
jgi:hypothetical protein